MFTATDNGSFLGLEGELSLANLSLVGLTGQDLFKLFFLFTS